ncbi:MAG: hypothetical protein M0Z42_08155 [Actinomycetota bacterium]|nr:hypothetical protein [Actinomycetota bacterium]
MASSADPTDLGLVSRALRQEPSFLAGWLSAAPGGEQRIKDRLGLTETSLHRLLVCRAPRPDRYLTDVNALAEYVDVDATTLAAALREAAVLAALGSGAVGAVEQAVPGSVGVLAAARDIAAEQLPASQGSSRVRELAEATWLAAPAEVRDRRDVQSAIVWVSPAIVVSLPRLHLATVNRWLTERGVPELPGGVGELRGLLVAWRGQAAIFVDGMLADAERRMTLAHEHGHLLLDYLAPRRRVLRDAPDLLDVVDGHRSATDADRARAVLARLPLGLHTHLLHRDDHGGARATIAEAEDDASLYALELLAPWEELLELLRVEVLDAGPYPDRHAAAASAVAQRFGLPSDAAAVRATAALGALGIRPGFFDR